MTSLSDVRLSVLDLSPIPSDGDAGTALRNTIDLARQTERLGYHRYWVAEHHNMPGIASSATAVLIGHVASATERIRVGSGGIMLPNHAPLIVAEQFGMLEAFHPGRIDLGIGRAPGTDQRTALAVRGSMAALNAENFPEQLTELMDYFEPDPARAVNAIPAVGHKPPVWLLGSSGFSAQLAGTLGLPFAFAHHFSARNTLPAVRLYRESFRPSSVLREPYLMLGVAVICAETDERAQWLAGPSGLTFLSLRRGRPIPLPTPEEAAEYPYTDLDRQFLEERFGSNVIGSPETVRKGLETLIADTGADEMMITTMVHGQADRVRSYELVADLGR
ncbi:LLM class flavin-dependent oxidoreductase [Amycolatopsis acidiphila]|uniref:LLM class flavin-dependent oxidoreductase n=1 Tax=Amycolatopsis acidiphila TaxID=715473 RepID=A0A558AC32_9PSEU|nr:LLM class flavin-dependent oxidoreductase [Amycolatopsis acidiphila]TVT21807.1 LLM class flavin-dependent oxidoreductase [Amycolatopsis acidiphila]UIJ61527.1 LLM class flavin-dependent oxidoreductase [Amycolatopsis acidiphila]GHG59413.1 FMN-linked alkanal monooxygenase [Amycolatopsis acidiphila]